MATIHSNAHLIPWIMFSHNAHFWWNDLPWFWLPQFPLSQFIHWRRHCLSSNNDSFTVWAKESIQIFIPIWGRSVQSSSFRYPLPPRPFLHLNDLLPGPQASASSGSLHLEFSGLLLLLFSCPPTFVGLRDCSMPGFSILHHLHDFAQTHVLWIKDACFSYVLQNPKYRSSQNPSFPQQLDFLNSSQLLPSSVEHSVTSDSSDFTISSLGLSGQDRHLLGWHPNPCAFLNTWSGLYVVYPCNEFIQP